MNGTGFQCDQCGERVVLTQNPFVMNGHNELPDGWLHLVAVGLPEVRSACPTSKAAGGAWDFCGWECAVDFTSRYDYRAKPVAVEQ